MPKILGRLNPSQRKAVTHEAGPLLIIAGPGSGKTRTVVRSIAYAIENGVQPDRILAFSFTGKACGTLKEEIKKIVGKEKADHVKVSTFHDFCRQVLREDIEKLRKGYTRDFKELKPKDQEEVITEQIAQVQAQINHLQHHKFLNTKEILDFITRCKLRFIPPSAARNHLPNPKMSLEISRAYVEIYERYESELETNGWIDYPNQLLLTNELFREVHNVKTKWQEYIDLIFVDEYQDTDPVQYRIITSLADQHQNLRIVGDDDQGIYGFRGADIQNILNFEKDYPTARVIPLEQNYRSTPQIVEASKALAEFNPDRRGKELFTQNFEGENVKYLHCKKAEEEVATIVSFIVRAIQYGWNSEDFAILCRLRRQVNEFKTAFNSSRIPQYVDGVSIMTIHGAKGLEFPNVFVAGVCKGLLPFGENDQNEERRLLYVAMTRAKNWLCLSSYDKDAASGGNGKSPFLDQIPQNLLDSTQLLGASDIPSKPIKSNGTESPTVVEKSPEPQHPHIRPEIVLGIDPGKIDAKEPNVGWAVTQKSSDGCYSVIDYDTETPNGTPDAKPNQIAHQINKLIADHSPDVIAVEKLKGAIDESFIGVAGCVALVRSIAYQHRIECAFYSPQQVKYAATGNRKANKEQVQEGVKKRCDFSTVQNVNDVDDHSADAIAVSLCYLDSYLNSSHLQWKKRKQEHYDSGINHLSNRQYDAAVAEFKEAISTDPIYTEAHYGLGQAYLAQGNLEEAENAAKKSLKLAENNHPDSQKLLNAIGHYRSGCNAINDKQFNEAITKFQESINLEPFFIQARYELSRAHLRLGNVKIVKNVVEKTLKLADDYPPIQQLSDAIKLYNAGLDFLNGQRYNDAIDKFKEAIDREPTFTEAHYWLGCAYFQSGGLEAAKQSANDGLELNPNYQLARALLDEIKKVYVDNGYDAFERLALSEAEKKYLNRVFDIDENYQPALKLFEKIKRAYYKQVCDYLNNKQYDHAIAGFNELINKYPNFIDAYCGLGRSHFERGELDAARKFANTAWQLDETYPPACTLLDDIKKTYVKKGRYALNQNNPIKAEKFAKEAYSLDKKYQPTCQLLNDIKQVYYKPGLAYMKVSEYAKAINQLLKTSDIDPDDKEVWTNLGRSYYWINDYANAANCYQKATDIDPNDKIAYTNFGNAYYWMGKYEMAIRPFQKAINIDQNCEKTHYYLARVYFKLGKFKEAMSEAEKALDIIPTYQLARKLLDNINWVSDHQMIMVPAGDFQMEINESNAKVSKNPMRTIHVDEFYIDIYPVTNAQYKKFVDENPEWQKERISSKYYHCNYLEHWNRNNYPNGKGNHPVTYVSWYAAMAYAQWTGKRLPTESEWEKATRGGLTGLKYPWGNLIDSNKANYGSEFEGTTPVGHYVANSYGLYDMVGNVWEWCLDEYNPYKNFLCRNRAACADDIKRTVSNFTNVKTSRVLRGGSWYVDAERLRIAYRFGMPPTNLNYGSGFRCVREAIT